MTDLSDQFCGCAPLHQEAINTAVRQINTGDELLPLDFLKCLHVFLTTHTHKENKQMLIQIMIKRLKTLNIIPYISSTLDTLFIIIEKCELDDLFCSNI